MEYNLLKELCEIFGPSGTEYLVRDFLIAYLESNKSKFSKKIKLIYGDPFQDCLIVAIGKPKNAAFVHMDSHGFTVQYENQLVPIGQPEVENGYILIGEDSLGPIECSLKVDKQNHLFYEFGRPIERGTQLVFKSNFRETEKAVQNCYLDNRLGLAMILKAAEQIEDGILCFSCWEEHGGGSVPYLARYIYDEYNVRQAIIADVTWVTDGVEHDGGGVISLRDRNVPRRNFIEKIIGIAQHESIKHQLEVEGSGSSDGRELQMSPYPFDWCFVGPPEDHVHSPNELVYKSDIESSILLYTNLINLL